MLPMAILATVITLCVLSSLRSLRDVTLAVAYCRCARFLIACIARIVFSKAFCLYMSSFSTAGAFSLFCYHYGAFLENTTNGHTFFICPPMAQFFYFLLLRMQLAFVFLYVPQHVHLPLGGFASSSSSLTLVSSLPTLLSTFSNFLYYIIFLKVVSTMFSMVAIFRPVRFCSASFLFSGRVSFLVVKFLSIDATLPMPTPPNIFQKCRAACPGATTCAFGSLL